MTFQDLMRRHRLEAGLTQEGLAERAGLSREAISALERGERRSPRRATLELLSDALGVDDGVRAELADEALRSRPARGIASGSRTTGMLPPTSTPLIGRDDVIALGMSLLGRPDVRLLSLIGPPGVGKTRLAIELAACSEERFADGVLFVPLTTATDLSYLYTAIAGQIGLGDRSRQTVQAALSSREALIVLDTLEHLVGAPLEVASLLGACPRLRVLVASRGALHIAGEQELPLPPLLEDAAIELFVDRARAIRPEFELSADTATFVADVCRCVDYLPLAIELAASRVRVLPVGELLRRLESGLSVLAGVRRDGDPRHQTLRSAIQWSYDLLQPDQQQLLRWLAVLPRECEVNALSSTMLADVEALVDRQLVQPTADGRLRLLNVIVEYAREALPGDGRRGRLDEQAPRARGWSPAAA